MFTKGQWIALAAIAVASMVLVSGCSTNQPPAGSTAVFPTGGQFRGQGPGELGEWIAAFQADGTFALTRHDGQTLRGTFAVTGNQLKVKGLPVCDSPDKDSGTYSWDFDGKTLNLGSSDDKCGDRWRIMTLVWTKQ